MESKNLKVVQNLFKIAKVLSQIVLVCCIIGVVFTIVGIIGLAVIPDTLSFNGVSIKDLIAENAGVGTGALIGGMAVSLVYCLGETLLARKASKCFAYELKQQTPFKFMVARKLKELGIAAIIIPAATYIVADLVFLIFKEAFVITQEFEAKDFGAFGIGIMLLITSVICKYGAEATGADDEEMSKAKKEKE